MGVAAAWGWRRWTDAAMAVGCSRRCRWFGANFSKRSRFFFVIFWLEFCLRDLEFTWVIFIIFWVQWADVTMWLQWADVSMSVGCSRRCWCLVQRCLREFEFYFLLSFGWTLSKRFRICAYFLYLLVTTCDVLSTSILRRRMMSRRRIDVAVIKRNFSLRNLWICFFFFLCACQCRWWFGNCRWRLVGCPHVGIQFLWLVGKTSPNRSNFGDFC